MDISRIGAQRTQFNPILVVYSVDDFEKQACMMKKPMVIFASFNLQSQPEIDLIKNGGF